MQYKSIFYINGILLLVLAAAMIVPTLVDLSVGNPDWKVFFGAMIVTGFVGLALMLTNHQKKFTMSLRETFVLTTLSWILMAVFAALPFYFSNVGLNYTRAFFEAMSGITTTGITVMSGLDDMAPGILLWRAMLIWLGGIGFLVIALAVLPMLQISGMQIFKTQSFEVEKVLPSANQIAYFICFIYIAMTILCMTLLHFAGMTWFDAICHGLATVATGGISTHDESIGYYNSGLIEMIIITFMLMGALPFALYLRTIKGDFRALFRDSQVKTFLRIIAAVTVVIALHLVYVGQFGFVDSFRHALFMTVSIMTTTGFVTEDYTFWGSFIISIAFMLTFFGSCSGSTAGGLKIFRLQILWATVLQQIRQLMTPHGISHVHYNGRIVDTQVQAAVAGYFFVYIMTWLFLICLLQLTGLDFTTAASGAVTVLSNMGVGVGPHIGPSGNYAPLGDDSIMILSVAMLVGRLEFFTLLVLLSPRFWKN